MAPKVKVHITPSSMGTKVFIDGEEQHSVRAININAEALKPSSLTIERVAAEIEIEGEVDHIIDNTSLEDQYRRFMPVRFYRPRGWNPYEGLTG